jgi:anti-sigma-K factor RskA
MEPREYIESGLLELYVYGLLPEDENRKIADMARHETEVAREIESIEKAVVNLSASFSPYLSADNFDKVRETLELRHKAKNTKRRPNWAAYTGWAAMLLMTAGAAYLFMELNRANAGLVRSDAEKNQLQEKIVTLETRNQATESVLAVVRDAANTAVPLAGQPAAPSAYAKIYWNKATEAVYVDASGLPDPPEGKVYQIWSLRLRPQLAPTSIGLLENFSADDNKLFSVSGTADAQAFGITLEPAGGSAAPSMDQLFVLGKV